MKPLSAIRPRRLLPLLFLALIACDRSHRGRETQTRQNPESKVTERSEPTESTERRQAREMLESVRIPQVEFESTSAEEASEFVQIQIAKIASEKAVRIRVRRPMPPEFKGRKTGTGQFCYSGHDLKAENISAWKVLERVAHDNRMSVEADERGVWLIPLPVDGKSAELLPIEEE